MYSRGSLHACMHAWQTMSMYSFRQKLSARKILLCMQLVDIIHHHVDGSWKMELKVD